LQELLQDSRPLFIAGESLGTGVACLLAAKHPDKVRGLFLATPYTSTTDVAQGRFPIFPVSLVMQDRYEAARALRKYRGPVAILLAGQDMIVPTHYGQKLFDGYGGPKRLWIQADAGHNTLDYDPQAKWWKEVSDFLQSA
jgi:pimeloyl-ACP methyl ester carboxylesterase